MTKKKVSKELQEVLNVLRDLYLDDETPPAVRLKAAESMLAHLRTEPASAEEDTVKEEMGFTEKFDAFLQQLSSRSAATPSSDDPEETPTE